jgi:catabolite regulation protein CreA
MTVMRTVAPSLAALIALTIPAYAQTRIDAINTNFRWLGPDDKIIVERYDDPKVANVSAALDLPKTRVDSQSRAERLGRSLSHRD